LLVFEEVILALSLQCVQCGALCQMAKANWLGQTTPPFLEYKARNKGTIIFDNLTALWP